MISTFRGTAQWSRYCVLLCAIIFGIGLFGPRSSANAAHIIIVPTYDSTIINDPNFLSIENTINSTIQTYEAALTTPAPLSVNITFKEVGTGVATNSTSIVSETYSAFRAALVSNSFSSTDATVLKNLAAGSKNPVNNSTTINLSTANARALGFVASTPVDSTISFNASVMNNSRSSPNAAKYDLQTVISHEIDDALGFGSALNGLSNGASSPTGSIRVLDLFRYDLTAGAYSFNTVANSTASLSIDGLTALAQFNQNSAGDYSDFYSPGGQTPRVQDAFITLGATPDPGVELTELDAIGYNLAPEPGTLCLATAFGVGVLLQRRRMRV